MLEAVHGDEVAVPFSELIKLGGPAHAAPLWRHTPSPPHQ